MEYRAVQKNSGDELTHWKYTKREKVGGKWKYWYDNAIGAVKKATGVQAKEDMEAQKRAMAEQDSKMKDQYEAIKDNEKKRSFYGNVANTLSDSYKDTEETVKNYASEAAERGYDSVIKKLSLEQDLEKYNKGGKISKDEYIDYVNKFNDITENEILGKVAEKNASIARQKLSKIETGKNRAKDRALMANALVTKFTKERNETVKKYIDARTEYLNSKSIYEKSLVGKIDKGFSWLKKKLGIH